ncbi:MAG TPA: hypothetical protein VFM48_11110, partial [Aquabacterium sp.]|nr:hypothetical protein [Aquabacterium sp.]
KEKRFDWWRALAQVLGSIEAVRDGRAMYVLLGAFAGAGTALAMARSAVARGQTSWAVVEGALALFIAFYGSQAAGLLLMDRALGRPAREVVDAVVDALGVGHRVLAVLLVALMAGAVVIGGVVALFWLCGLPVIGPWLYALALPMTVLVLAAGFIAFASVIGPLTGPMVWFGSTSRQTLAQLMGVLQQHVLRAATMMVGLSLVTGLVGAAASVVVLMAGRAMAALSILVLGVDVPAEILMAGLLGHTVQAVDARVVSPDALPYITAANVGGGVVFALALVLPTLVYLRGVCEIYLLIRPKTRHPVH